MKSHDASEAPDDLLDEPLHAALETQRRKWKELGASVMRGPDITGDLTAPGSEHLGRKSSAVVNGRCWGDAA